MSPNSKILLKKGKKYTRGVTRPKPSEENKQIKLKKKKYYRLRKYVVKQNQLYQEEIHIQLTISQKSI
jgi:predicted XRE-type DNA-binding protein